MKTTDVAKDLIHLMIDVNYLNINNKGWDDSEIDLVNNTKLQKILYIVMGVALRVGVIARTPVQNNQKEIVTSIFDELPEAWNYGPVFKNVYKNYNQLKLEALQNYIPSYEDTKGKNIVQQRDDEIMKIILRAVVASQIVKQNAVTLSNWSHKDGSPWDVVRKHYGGFGFKIDTAKIRNYFNGLQRDDLYDLDIESIESEANEIRQRYLNEYNKK